MDALSGKAQGLNKAIAVKGVAVATAVDLQATRAIAPQGPDQIAGHTTRDDIQPGCPLLGGGLVAQLPITEAVGLVGGGNHGKDSKASEANVTDCK